MKKTLTRRLVAVAMIACMILAMALPASAVEKYTLTLEVTEAKETGADGITTVKVENSSVSTSESLTLALFALLVGDGQFDKSEFLAFESQNMSSIIIAGLLAFKDVDEDGGAAWNAWLDTFAAKNEITGNKRDLLKLIKEDKTVGDMVANTPYKLQYSPADADVDDDDCAKGNTYTFTLTLNRVVIGGGGGGTPSTPSTPSIPSTPSTPSTPDTPKDVVEVPEAAAPGAVVTLPVEDVKVGQSITISTKSDKPVKVEIPVAGATVGTVAVIVKADGTEKIVRDGIVTENGVRIEVSNGDKIVIRDNTKKFNDVADNFWGNGAVTFVAARGIFSGVGNDNFAPNQTTNRAMVVQVLHNLEYNAAHTVEHAFSDVQDSHWYDKAVSWGAENKIVSGYSDGTFQGEKDVTRQELVVMLWNYAGKQAGSGKNLVSAFDDGTKVADWALTAVNWALENGILSGKGENRLDPTGVATRAELAQMIKNFCENK